MQNTNFKVDFLGKRKVQLGFNDEKLANFYGITPLVEKKDSVNHHILLVDVSGSMYSNLDELRIRLNQTLNALIEGNNNYVSVILYSSHGECFRIVNAVKCDTLSYKMAKVQEVIEKELYCRSLTVISEPMEQAIEISESLADICDKHHIILFTDGCVVPSKWGYKEEEEKCFDVAAICKERNYFLNAIGFGNYYDREFLKTLTEIANGTVNHIDEIPQYYDAVLELVNKVNDGVIVECPISNSDFFVVEDATHYHSKKILKSLKKNSSNLIVVFDDDLILGDEIFLSSDIDVEETNLQDLLYALTLKHIIYEDVDSAEVTMAQTGDINLFKALNGCYSFSEKGNVINKLQTALVNKETRFTSGKEEIKVLSPEEEPICLLEVLDDILKDNKSSLLWDINSKYKRISQKTKSIEDDVVFKYPQIGYMPINSITIAGNKLNVNVKATISGEVLNKKTTMKMDAKVYRDYALIKNGIINVNKIAAILSDDLKVKFKDLIIERVNFNGEDLVVLDLMKIKTTNKRMLKSIAQDVLAQYLYDVEVLGVKQWAIKQHLKELTSKLDIQRIDLSDLPQEVIDARKAFRIDEKGVYSPLEVEKDSSELFELYQATVLEWKIEKFPKTKMQKELLEEYSKYFDESNPKGSFDKLNSLLIEVQNEKRTKENRINLVRISSGLIRKPIFLWEEVSSKAKKSIDKTFNMNMVVGGICNISTKTINDIKIREDKYSLLIKSN